MAPSNLQADASQSIDTQPPVYSNDKQSEVEQADRRRRAGVVSDSPMLFIGAARRNSNRCTTGNTLKFEEFSQHPPSAAAGLHWLELRLHAASAVLMLCRSWIP